MSNSIKSKNINRYVQLGVTIAGFRKIKGMTQAELAATANISQAYLSAIENPNIVKSFSLEVFYNIADALCVSPRTLIDNSLFPEDVSVLDSIGRSFFIMD